LVTAKESTTEAEGILLRATVSDILVTIAIFLVCLWVGVDGKAELPMENEVGDGFPFLFGVRERCVIRVSVVRKASERLKVFLLDLLFDLIPSHPIAHHPRAFPSERHTHRV
jgi:hypothetical protein